MLNLEFICFSGAPLIHVYIIFKLKKVHIYVTMSLYRTGPLALRLKWLI